MFLNSFSVRVPEGNESSGYVELYHDTQYTLILRNNRDVRCDAKVEIDGKHVGTWRINARSNLSLERPAHDDGRFTFYKIGTREARQSGLSENDSNLGLVRVTFTPEKKIEAGWMHTSKSPFDAIPLGIEQRMLASDRSAGGTGLSGKSNQQFTSVRELDYDYSQQTVIHLRLVARNGNEPRPLTAFSTPVPPSVR